MKSLLPILAFAACLSQPAMAQPAQRDMALDAATRSAVVESLIDRMHRHYVFPATAKQVEARLRADLKDGKYDGYTSARQFAKALSTTLRGTAKDGHLRVRYSADKLPRQLDPVADKDAIEAASARDASQDHGVAAVERLAGNVGYLKIDWFPDAKYVQEVYASAMTLLNGTSALIIDVRGNRGGEPGAVALLESYFFDKPTHVNSVYERPRNATREYWTTTTLKGPHYGQSKPVYILTSQKSFSGGEDLAYSMQAQKRATIIGAVTGGAANPGEMQRLHDHFEVFVSDGSAVNPVTRTNWEGTGVTPDIAVAPDQALQHALALAQAAR